MDKLFRQIQNIFRLIGRKGRILFLIGILATFGVSCGEYAIAIFLMLFMFTLNLVGLSQLPAWLPMEMLRASPGWIWGCLFLIVTTKAICDVLTYQTKILFTEYTHARMRTLLGYQILKREDGSVPLALSRVNLYMSELFPKATSFIFHFTQFLTFCIQAAMISVGMFFLCWAETIVGLVALGLMSCVVIGFNRHTNKIAQRVPEAQAGLELTKVRIIRNRLLIKILRLQDREFKTYCNSIFLYYKNLVTAYFWGNLGGFLIPILGTVIVAVIVTLNLRIFHSPTVNLVAFLYLFIRFQQKVANISNTIGSLFIDWTHFRQAAALFASYPKKELATALLPVRDFKIVKQGLVLPPSLEREPNSETDLPDCFDSNKVGPNKTDIRPPEIRLAKVAFSWPGTPDPVFESITFTVAPGTQLGIVGTNGSGNSTLLSVILGVLSPGTGQVFIGGLKSEAYFRQASNSIGYVGPEPFLIYGSIRANISYGLGHSVSEDDIWGVLRLVGLDEFVQRLPEGLEYIIQENGEGLSSGQKQRLTVARAFLRNPSLLILDEPLSNVDSATEKVIIHALKALKARCTTIIVSHRLKTLSGADNIFDMETSTYEKNKR